jgi:hypothetical protein
MGTEDNPIKCWWTVINLVIQFLSSDWFSLVLLYHVCHQVAGLTEFETPVADEVSGEERDLGCLLY